MKAAGESRWPIAVLLALPVALAPPLLPRSAPAAPPGFVERAPGNGYQALAAGPDGRLYVTQVPSSEDSAIVVLDPRTGGSSRLLVPTEDAHVAGITAGPGARLWFTEPGVGQIGRLEPASGQIVELPLAATHGPLLARPGPITAGPDGNLWFVQLGPQGPGPAPAAFVGRLTPAGQHTEFRTPSDGAFGPDEGIAVGPDGRIWFTESAKGRLGRLDPLSPDPQATLEEIDLPAELGAPLSIAAGPDGALWVGGVGGLARVAVDGSAIAGRLPGALAGVRVTGIAAGADGRLWFTLPSAGALGRVDPATLALDVYPVGSSAVTHRPTAIVRGPDGNIWYTDPGSARIGQASFLSILPPPGTLISTQTLDVTVVNHLADRVVVGGRMLLDGAEVTGEFLGCVGDSGGRGHLLDGGQTFRCRAVPAGFLRAGPHVVEAQLDLDAGPPLRQAVAWDVLGSVEPGFGPGPFPGVFGELIVTPAAGQVVTTQSVDFVVAVRGGSDIVGQEVRVDGLDVTAAALACEAQGSLLDGGVTRRCAGIPAALMTPGVHLLEVAVTTGPGPGITLRRTIELQAVPNSEP